MAWRFKASKYKNAAPIVPKPEACIRDVCVGSYQTYGNNICASAAFMAFNWEHVGSSMAVLPLDDCGRKSKTMPLLHAHSDTITDMEFSPFHDGLLLTGSQDSLVKVWHIPPEGLKESLTTPECTLSQKQRRVENVGFHPVADGLIHVASGHELALWDLTQQKEAFVNRDHTEVIQSTSWKKDGKLVATSCKDKKVRIVDPRAASPVLGVANSHQNIKDSRLVWLGDTDRILTTGFDSARLRQIMIRDIRNLSQTQKTLELDCSTGVLMPLFDADTNMLFLAGKGDTTILYMELSDREPYLIEGLRHSGEQTKGACLVPKRALRVMEGEVNRVLQLTGSSVVPIMYQVPRKSYREYHADLYPETSGAVTYVSAPMWLEHQDHPVPSISLHPNANNCTQVHRGDLEELVKAILSMPPLKKTEPKPIVTQQIEEPSKPAQKPGAQEPKDEDRIDFVNVKDLIKGMERQKPEPKDYCKENGFHKTIIDNGHDSEKKLEDDVEVSEKTKENFEKTEKFLEKRESSDSSESLSRSNSLMNGGAVQVPKPLPRSSISEAGSADEPSEAPKPKPRTTAVPISGYKPRLGPKPFSASAGSDEFSFDKVFSVPAVPGLPKSDSGESRQPRLGPKPFSASAGSDEFSFDKVFSVPAVPGLPKSDSGESRQPRLGPKPFSASAGSDEFSFDKVFSVPAVPGLPKSDSGESRQPRLGPKPFSASAGSDEFSFDKVFSVPAVPGLPKSDSGESRQPRLGPKPLSASAGSDEFSFDKVFSVPAVPGLPKSDSGLSPVSAPAPLTPVTSTPIAREDDKEKSLTPTSDVDVAPNKEEYTNGKSDTSLEEEVNSSDSGYRPKTPGTAERRRMFEATDGNQSIADRRRAYEARSASVAAEAEAPPSPAPLRRRDSLKSRKSPEREEKRSSVPNVTTKRTSTVFGKVSKFRHLKGTPGHKSTHVENIKNISRQISGECNGFYANGTRCAVPIGGGGGGGGRIGVVELPLGCTSVAAAPPPHPSALHPHALLHPAPLQDWSFDPFSDQRLVVACDDGLLREWIIPEGGLVESSNEPLRTFSAHPDKIYMVRFHPTAADLLTTAAHDLSVKIWDLRQHVPVAEITLSGHTDQIFAMDWSPCGEYLATVCKDGFVRIYKPRASTEPIRQGAGPVGSRGARVVWALHDTHLVVTGFDKVSERQILLYKASELSAPVCTVGLDVSPAILHIHIDHDSNTLFLTGRVSFWQSIGAADPPIQGERAVRARVHRGPRRVSRDPAHTHRPRLQHAVLDWTGEFLAEYRSGRSSYTRRASCPRPCAPWASTCLPRSCTYTSTTTPTRCS
ncbi:coronin-7 isoform X1 [Maniola hyperantus]|uniref:coronin-7 isoform X1 n=1 Tax=Aphantopus hyperantus TaxID=2795564 RepID=UPI00374982F3